MRAVGVGCVGVKGKLMGSKKRRNFPTQLNEIPNFNPRIFRKSVSTKFSTRNREVKRFIILVAAAIAASCSPALALAAPAQATVRPIDVSGRKVDPVFSIQVNTAGEALGVNADDPTYMRVPIQAQTLSTTNLGNAGVFTSDAIETPGYVDGTPYDTFSAVAMNVVIGSDQNGTWKVEASDDASTWVQIAGGSLTATSGVQTGVNLAGRYHRVVYTNGATPQTAFRLAISFR